MTKHMQITRQFQDSIGVFQQNCSKAVNDAVGSKDSSQHRTGCAADIRLPGMTPDQIVRAILADGLVFDQVIKEFDRWVHISVPSQAEGTPRQLALVIDQHSTSLFV